MSHPAGHALASVRGRARASGRFVGRLAPTAYDRVMKTGCGVVSAPLRVTLASMVWAMFVVPALQAISLLTLGPDVAAAVTVAALALVFAAVVRLGTGSMVLVVNDGSPILRTGDEAPLVLPGRSTDPVHHPLRPRAPGLA
jgi:hypothetical protein